MTKQERFAFAVEIAAGSVAGLAIDQGGGSVIKSLATRIQNAYQAIGLAEESINKDDPPPKVKIDR